MKLNMAGDKSCFIQSCLSDEVWSVWSDGGKIPDAQVAEEMHALFSDIQRRELLSFLRWLVPHQTADLISQLPQKIMLTLSEDGAKLKALPWCPNGTFRTASLSLSLSPAACVSVSISSSAVCVCAQAGISFSSFCGSSSRRTRTIMQRRRQRTLLA